MSQVSADPPPGRPNRKLIDRTERSTSRKVHSLDLISINDGEFPSVTYQGDRGVESSPKSQAQDEVLSYLGTYLDLMVEKRGFSSDSDLAKYFGISRQHISRIRKSGVMSDEKCLKVAKELDIDPLELFSYMRAQKEKSSEVKEIWMTLHRNSKREKDSILLNRNLGMSEQG